MSLNLVTGYPLWFVLLCLILGLAYAMALYYKEKKHELPLALVRVLSAIRFLVVSLLSFFLLSPLLETVSRSTEKPIIIVGQDNSSSILAGDSVYYRHGYLDAFKDMIVNLGRDYEVRLYSIGGKTEPVEGNNIDTIQFAFDEKLSDLAAFFNEIDVLYSNRNVGAVVFASDGIFNKGINPAYAAKDLAYPLYTVALGDTSIRRDVILKRLNYNRIAFKGNEFPLEVQINAYKCRSRSVTVRVAREGQLIDSKTIRINSDRFSSNVLFTIEAPETGLLRYRVTVTPLDNEINTRNNYMDAFIDILEAKQKVLILANSPHPDVSAIRQALADNLNYEVEDRLIADAFPGPFNGYNLVILHQLPSFNPLSARIVNEINGSDMPVLYIIGQQTDLGTFNGLKTGLTLVFRERSRLTEAQPSYNESFVLFRLSEEVQASLKSFPPLYAPFGEYRLVTNADVLLYQRIGSVITEYPLLMINKTLDKKMAALCGEGIWKWRIADYARSGQHRHFNEVIDKLVQYLAIQEDKSLFRVDVPQTVFENEHVVFDASLYNESYEPVNEPEVELKISSADGIEFDYNFNKQGDGYILDAGGFPVGEYKYRASTQLGTDNFTDAGEFTILPLEVELSSTVADHNLLYRMAAASSGIMLRDDELDRIPDLIKAREDVKPVVYSQKRFTDLINLPWIFALLILLLGIEWFLRKYAGSY
jgi:hypothetical protein